MSSLDWQILLRISADVRERKRVVRRSPLIDKLYEEVKLKDPSFSRLCRVRDGLSTNLYPYDCREDIHHYIFWTREWRVERDTLRLLIPENLDFVHYLNRKEDRSVPHRPHAHVFIRSQIGIPTAEQTEEGSSVTLRERKPPLETVWRSPLFSRWPRLRTLALHQKSKTATDLSKLAFLLMRGGFASESGEPLPETSGAAVTLLYRPPSIDGQRLGGEERGVLNEGTLFGCTAMHPFLYRYFDEAEEWRGLLTLSDYYARIEKWQVDAGRDFRLQN